jgi:hypothetical protein
MQAALRISDRANVSRPSGGDASGAHVEVSARYLNGHHSARENWTACPLAALLRHGSVLTPRCRSIRATQSYTADEHLS